MQLQFTPSGCGELTVSLFDNWSDINLSTTMLQKDIFNHGQPFYPTKHRLTRDLLKRRQKRSLFIFRLARLSEAVSQKLSFSPSFRRESSHFTILEDEESRDEKQTRSEKLGRLQRSTRRSIPESLLASLGNVQELLPSSKQEESFTAPKPLARPLVSDQVDENEANALEGTSSSPKQARGQLWTWGFGRNGKYDRLTSNLCEPRPLNLNHQLSSTIISVACSSSHALFATGAHRFPSLHVLLRSYVPCYAARGEVFALGEKTSVLSHSSSTDEVRFGKI